MGHKDPTLLPLGKTFYRPHGQGEAMAQRRSSFYRFTRTTKFSRSLSYPATTYVHSQGRRRRHRPKPSAYVCGSVGSVSLESPIDHRWTDFTPSIFPLRSNVALLIAYVLMCLRGMRSHCTPAVPLVTPLTMSDIPVNVTHYYKRSRSLLLSLMSRKSPDSISTCLTLTNSLQSLV